MIEFNNLPLNDEAYEINYRDPMATHALAHVYESRADPEGGINWLNSTENGWSQSNHFAGHHYWHRSLFHVAKGDYEGALSLFDEQISGNNKRQPSDWGTLDMSDAASLLYRLDYEGVPVGDRWNQVCDAAKLHIEDHNHLFNDLHFLMAYIGAKKPELSNQFQDSIKEFATNYDGTNAKVSREVGIPLMEGLAAYDNHDYDEVVEKVYPIRYGLNAFGGSHAQRDVFQLLLINSAIQSSKPKNHRIARTLIMERKSLKPGCSQTERMAQRLMAKHEIDC